MAAGPGGFFGNFSVLRTPSGGASDGVGEGWRSEGREVFYFYIENYLYICKLNSPRAARVAGGIMD